MPFPGAGRQPAARWKLSDMDSVAQRKWVEFSKAKATRCSTHDSSRPPVVHRRADDKRRARLN